MQNKLNILLVIFLISITAAPNGALAYREPHDHQHIQRSFQNTTRTAEIPTWIARSNENAKVLLAVQARFSPESAGQIGIEGLDEQIVDLQPKLRERSRQAIREAMQTLRGRLSAEKDAAVRQDLEILIETCENQIRGSELAEKYNLPYYNATQIIFNGLRALLDDQIATTRRPSALVRLRRYTGMEAGYTPLTVMAEQRMREKLAQTGLIAPIKDQVEKNLRDTKVLTEGIGKLFVKYGIVGYEESFAKLKEQLAAYDAFVRAEILPKARTDFRMHPELYAYQLKQMGVDVSALELAAMARRAFTEIQREMQALAPRVAREKGHSLTDYRDVIRALKREQIVGEAILPHYQKRNAEIEEIIRREKIVTLPERQTSIRLASAAESATMPSPHMRPPRMVGNTGEMGEFVLPLHIPSAPGSTRQFDDFTHTAASWSLAAHEARPGHEMQFAAMIERGVSTARSTFAWNNVNVEGWGLYSEALIKPYMPLDGQLISLQFRLQRAARAFLDPELQMGLVAPQEALRILKDDVVLSDAWANQEVERYTFRMPAQATSYFYGYMQLIKLRADVEKALGKKFDQQKFHDFILSQGLLPPRLIRKAVFDEFLHC